MTRRHCRVTGVTGPNASTRSDRSALLQALVGFIDWIGREEEIIRFFHYYRNRSWRYVVFRHFSFVFDANTWSIALWHYLPQAQWVSTCFFLTIYGIALIPDLLLYFTGKLWKELGISVVFCRKTAQFWLVATALDCRLQVVSAITMVAQWRQVTASLIIVNQIARQPVLLAIWQSASFTPVGPELMLVRWCLLHSGTSFQLRRPFHLWRGLCGLVSKLARAITTLSPTPNLSIRSYNVHRSRRRRFHPTPSQTKTRLDTQLFTPAPQRLSTPPVLAPTLKTKCIIAALIWYSFNNRLRPLRCNKSPLLTIQLIWLLKRVKIRSMLTCLHCILYQVPNSTTHLSILYIHRRAGHSSFVSLAARQ